MEESFDKPSFLLSTSIILIQSVIFLMNYWDYYLEQSVNIKMIKRHIWMLIL